MNPFVGETMQYDLGWACLLLHAWMQIAALDDSGSAGPAAVAKFEEFALPAAVLDPASTLRENAAWRTPSGFTRYVPPPQSPCSSENTPSSTRISSPSGCS